MEYADSVKCTNCESELLLPCGTERCPICGGELMWLDGEVKLN